MAALPYMQLYIADYLADTMHLSTEEHGAYLLLMFNYWQTGKPIPKNRLAKIARVSDSRWAELETALSEFFEDDGDSWVHLRIERDIETVVSSPRGKKLPVGETLKGFSGYVYFIKNHNSGLVKVGYSKNPWARLAELRRNYGSELSVVATIKTVEKSEVSIHAALAEFRVEGEWFFESECIKSLILAIVAGEITTVEATRSYVENYCSSATATTNTDTDLKDKTPHIAREENLPLEQNTPPPPEYVPDGDEPIGKFPMFSGWAPSLDFRQRVALMGVILTEDYQPTELASFVMYWQPEGKAFHQIQWEQKFARHIQQVRSGAGKPKTGGSDAGTQQTTSSGESRAMQKFREAQAQRYGADAGRLVGGDDRDIHGSLDSQERGGAITSLGGSDWPPE